MPNCNTKPRAELDEFTVEKIKGYFSDHPDIKSGKDETREYEEAIVQLIDQNQRLLLGEAGHSLANNTLHSLIDCDDEQIQYASFYALCTFYRRHGNWEEYERLLNEYRRDPFTDHPSYEFLRIMCKTGKNGYTTAILEDAERLCDPESDRNLICNYGVLHFFAECVAEICEKNTTDAPYLAQKYIPLALKRAEDAIRQSKHYAKFYVTRARLKVLSAIYCTDDTHASLFRSAQEDIDYAIEHEHDNTKKINYQLTGLRLQSDYYESRIDQSILEQEEKLDRKIQKSNVKNLEFLSFFSAVIGLLLAGTQLMLNLTFPQSAALILTLTGCLIAAFGALGFILHEKERIAVNIIIVLIGFLILVVGILIGGLYGGLSI